MMDDLRIIFMGTPDFAVQSLDILVKKGLDVRAVITAPDRPAGRGRKLNQSAIKKYADSKAIPVLQPSNLKDPDFIEELKAYNANLQIVVAFRMLPEIIWSMPKFGTFNLHASLLPQYRGAAPINWAIINGEKETGITTFFLDQKIDTGKIIFQESVKISSETNAGELHDTLMSKGAELVHKTVQAIAADNLQLIEQTDTNVVMDSLKPAPKIFKNDTRIDWEKSGESILNLINGLSPYPGAFTLIKSENSEPIQLKIYAAEYFPSNQTSKIGSLISDGKSSLSIACSSGLIVVRDVQLSGKKRMKTEDFLRGFPLKDGWIAQ
jgi:methionyl-tRNA formyltransferase